MQEEDFKSLLHRYENGTASDEEKAFVEDWYLQQGNKEGDLYSLSDKVEDANELWTALQPGTRDVPIRPLWPRIAVAGLLLVIMGTGAYIFLNRRPKSTLSANDVAPYTAMAVLKSGGTTIMLDKTANGLIGRTTITKSSGGLLSYSDRQKNMPAEYDTIQIPAGGRPYTIKLSDGSKITVNAATTLRYPTAFSKTRKENIELISGEIYLDVVHNPEAPMKVIAPGLVITDIGTEFNVEAYTDEPYFRTTLVSGSVGVHAAGEAKVLTPGRQATLASGRLTEGPANLAQTAAWKAGLFRFTGERIDVIMRQLARWYNIQVSYDGEMTDEAFYGVIDRSRNISEVLRILELSKKVYFKIEGRRVIVLSK